MTARDNIAADALAVCTDTDGFAEALTYYPHQGFGEAAPASRSISGIVVRRQINTYEDDVATQLKEFEVYVANDATSGISSTELDLGGDRIGIPDRDGKSEVIRTILELTDQDHGGLVLLCR